MASPVAARAVLFVLYAFNVEVSRAPWLTQETMIAEMRLQWWRDVLEEIGQGAQVRRHEVVTPLSGFLSEPATQVLDRLVAARRWDIYKDAFEDAAHFDNYLNETAAGLMGVAACALDPDLTPQGDAEAMVRACGRATGLARFLQAVPVLESHSRIPLVDGRAEAIADLARAALDALPAPKLAETHLGGCGETCHHRGVCYPEPAETGGTGSATRGGWGPAGSPDAARSTFMALVLISTDARSGGLGFGAHHQPDQGCACQSDKRHHRDIDRHPAFLWRSAGTVHQPTRGQRRQRDPAKQDQVIQPLHPSALLHAVPPQKASWLRR